MIKKMDDTPPLVCKIPDGEKDRYAKLRSKFKERFGHDPIIYARAPGRVNLIGEHIDYCGYAVLPMAIEQDIVFAVSTNNSKEITLVNQDPSYKEFSCSLENFTISRSDPQWYNYALCGVRGIIEHVGAGNGVGFNALVDGSVPKSAGLSSSSALVCCAALATAQLNGWTLTKKVLAEVCAKCEHYIGTEGGGMDQAISFMANHGMAKLIEFNPLRTTNILLPAGAAFIITNSLVEHNKAATSDYNIRVVECRLAAQVLAKAQGLPWREARLLGGVQKQLGLNFDEMLSLVKETIHKDPYNKDELCQLLEVTPDELALSSLSQNTTHVTSFKLFQRAIHVYSEASRVYQFRTVCEEQPSDALQRLGHLMDESHASCRDLYECSHPDLDKLVQICRDSGALGSRMTGAGWGGCGVSLVESKSIMSVLTKVRDAYYTPDPARALLTKQALFATQPGNGAEIYTN